jgi:hypothetical protein
MSHKTEFIDPASLYNLAPRGAIQAIHFELEANWGSLPTSAARLAFKWPRQVGCDPPAVKISWLCNSSGTVNTALEVVCIKSNAVG